MQGLWRFRPFSAASGAKLEASSLVLLNSATIRASLMVAIGRVSYENMTFREFNAFCRALPATTYVVQWGGSHVWKVGGKVFAIGSGPDVKPHVTFKVSDIAYEILKDQPGLRPAPYLASRGMKWIQHFA